MSLEKYDVLLVIDVEAIGLHGEGFAVGMAAYDREEFVKGDTMPEVKERVSLFCKPELARGTAENFAWVKENVKIFGVKSEHTQARYPTRGAFIVSELANPRAVRTEFWRRYMNWQRSFHKVALIGDCIWPVETNFLSACIEDESPLHTWKGPYPFLDIASLVGVLGGAPCPRLPNELPEHDPLNDALQSARQLWEFLHKKEVGNG